MGFSAGAFKLEGLQKTSKKNADDFPGAAATLSPIFSQCANKGTVWRRIKNMKLSFKGNNLPFTVALASDLAMPALSQAAEDMFREGALFENEAAVLDLDATDCEHLETADWPGIRALFARHGLALLGVRGKDSWLMESALAAGFFRFPAERRGARPPLPQAKAQARDLPPGAASAGAAVPREPGAARQADLFAEPAGVAAAATSLPQAQTSDANKEAAKAAAEAPTPEPERRPTKVVSVPVRSGARVYEPGVDLVVLNMVQPGAEVISDGNIHIYGPLRGRALAGAKGDANARIFTTCFEAQLVAIAGLYRNFENGLPPDIAGHAAQAFLDAKGEKMLLAPLSTH
jgi:septum site-determining protein MinC